MAGINKLVATLKRRGNFKILNTMKKQEYILKIDKPCSESWTSMTTNATGKYCSHCTKNVVDFHNLTDNEVLRIIGNTTGKICGRFYEEQLNRLLVQTGGKSANPRLYKILAGLLLLSSSDNINAIEQPTQTEIVSEFDKNINTQILEDPIKYSTQKDSITNIVQGKVIDAETREPLISSAIVIKDTKVFVQTDSTGKFKIAIPDSLLSKNIIFQVILFGYETAEFTVDKNDLPITKELLMIPKRMLKGELQVIEKPINTPKRKSSH